ncbi:TPA: helix-turn-helix transcriptional regulator [Streptococcus suis]
MEKLIEQRAKKIDRLQKNLSSVRKIAGWTTEVLGEKIGVTKQTISNLENKKTPMNFTQYIAIRAVLDAEIENNKENTVLPDVITILLDSEEELDDDTYEEVQKSVSQVAASAAGGVSGVALATIFAALVPIAGNLLVAMTALNWKKLLK